MHKLIIQNCEIDRAATMKREKWKKTTHILIQIIAGTLLALIGIGLISKDVNVVYGLIPIALLILVIVLLKGMIKRKRIYSYWYSQLFPFRVYMSPYSNQQSDTFIHSKIYIIDDRIAYLGSLNFTSSGTRYNYETRIRTEEPYAIKEIKHEFDRLMNHSHLPQRDIYMWGKQLYPEPIN